MATKYVDYNEVGEFFGEIGKPLTVENYEVYRQEHGDERALGYLQAIQDFTEEFKIMLNKKHNDRFNANHNGRPASGQIVINFIDKLCLHNQNFLYRFEELKEDEKINSAVPKYL